MIHTSTCRAAPDDGIVAIVDEIVGEPEAALRGIPFARACAPEQDDVLPVVLRVCIVGDEQRVLVDAGLGGLAEMMTFLDRAGPIAA
jgi:hypothetical protein